MKKKLYKPNYLQRKKILEEGGLRLSKKIKKKPLFTIITVVLNGDKYLRETIESIKNQKFNNFEYIIIDGRSTDKSLKIINEYKNFIDYWVSEKDKGLYDAFNKGIKLSRGDYIGIVNSDDIYKPNALKIINKYIKKNPTIDFIFGSVKKHWGVLHGYKPNKITYSWGFYSSHSTGFFIKKEAANKVGPYNIKYKYHADYDYFYRMIVKKKLRGIATNKNEITGIFRRGGFSSTIAYRKLFYEEMLIRYNNGQSFLFLLMLSFYKLSKNWKKFLK